MLLVLVAGLSVLAYVLSRNAPCVPMPAVPEGADAMKAVIYRCYGSPDVLELADVEKPAPAAGEILVRIRAASVNPLDWHYMRGSPYLMRLQAGLGRPKDPRLGVDFAGTVEAVGAGVTRFRPGDDVFGAANGAFAEYVTVREDRGVVPKPPGVSFAQAASVPIAAITALQALRDKGRVGPGRKVLINGASGGVGTFAVQIAKSLGAEVAGVCSTRNVEMVRSLGADRVFDYTREDYTESGEQFDVIIDLVGNHSPLENRRAMTPEGTLVVVGGSKGNWVGPFANSLKAMIVSPFVGQAFEPFLARMNREDLAELAGLLESGEVTPVIDRRYPLSELPAAVRYSEEGHARGKIVIEVD